MTKLFEKRLYPFRNPVELKLPNPAHHPVVIIGAGPTGLCAAIDLALRDIPIVIIDENEKVGQGSRAICFSKRTLEICDRLGIGDRMIEKGVQWNLGKVFFDSQKVYEFNLLEEEGHERPAFINLQQYYLETFLVERVRELQSNGAPLEIRGSTTLFDLQYKNDSAFLTLQTPSGAYNITSDWVIACDGANSTARRLLKLDFKGRIFEDNFLIADVKMDAEFPTERWFWFDPPFNKGQSALLHKQPDGIWRIDLQLGWGIDKEKEKKKENVLPRIRAMLGSDIKFEIEWISIYTFRCLKMDNFVHQRVIFAGDSAHQVSPFGARGANSGIQDVDNLCWKLAAVVKKEAPPNLLESYDIERSFGTKENILNSTRSTDFITPKSEISKIFRDAVLELSENYTFARPLVNSGRLSLPCTYEKSEFFGPDCLIEPRTTRPGAPCLDGPLNDSYLLRNLGPEFTLLDFNNTSGKLKLDSIFDLKKVNITTTGGRNQILSKRYLGTEKKAIYLIRPDQHIVARWRAFDQLAINNSLKRTLGHQL